VNLDSNLLIDAFVVYGNYLYFASQDIGAGGLSNGVIARIATNGGSTERLLSGLGHPWELAADADSLYWAEAPPSITGNGHLAKSTLTGSGLTKVADVNAISIATFKGRVYFSTGSEVKMLAAPGGSSTDIATGLNEAGLLTVSGANIVWVEPSQQKLSNTAPAALMTACLP